MAGGSGAVGVAPERGRARPTRPQAVRRCSISSSFRSTSSIPALLRGRVQDALRLEDDALHLVQLESLAAQAGDELLARDRLASQRPPSTFPFAYSVVGPPWSALPKRGLMNAVAHDDDVHREQDRGAEQPARERVVVPDHRVLDDVREQQQHDEVERVQLRELALPGQVQQDEQPAVDGGRAERLLAGRDPHVHRSLPHVDLGSLRVAADLPVRDRDACAGDDDEPDHAAVAEPSVRRVAAAPARVRERRRGCRRRGRRCGRPTRCSGSRS